MIQINRKNIGLIKKLILNFDSKLYLYKKNGEFYISDSAENYEPEYILPETNFSFSKTFLKRFELKYPYIAGAMAKGISSVEMVKNIFKTGCLGNFGSAGLSNDQIIKNVDILKSETPTFGINIINIPGNQNNELELLQILDKKGVRIISAGAYIKMTPGLVFYRLKGVKKNSDGKIIIPNKILAKISRTEIAKRFLSPPPAKTVKNLFDKGLITREEMLLAESIPMSSDIIAEADSGGHTDKQPAVSLFPEIYLLKKQFQKNYESIKLHAGLAGGISTPWSAYAAFSMGADFIVTGSINQSCLEANTSKKVKFLLSKALQGDFDLVPSADTFELGGKVQILKKGSKFSSRSKYLEKIYNNYNSFEDLPDDDKNFIETKILKKKIEEEWESTKKYLKKIKPDLIDTAEKNPRKKTALIIKSYLGQSSWWAVSGDENREEDFQIWSGPSISSFNSWVKGSFLESPENRNVSQLAKNILNGFLYISRIKLLIGAGIDLLEEIMDYYPEKIK
ncbi:MAG: 2-nitropropane dioxygenase [Deltaproteobacteria bacterium]|nr:MAG: 2-nitropropane dioxygenase [Deltaproteobacteria bacterium]